MSDTADANVTAHLDEFFARPRPAGYAALFTPAALRERVRVICALHGLIRDVGRINEASVAQTKLAWWQDELRRLTEGRARHPLCALLSAEAHDATSVANHLREAVYASAADIANTPLDSNDAIEAHCAHAEGSRLRATVAACGPIAAALDPPLATLAHGIGLTRLLTTAQTTDEAAELTRDTAATLLADGLNALASIRDRRGVFPIVLGTLWQQRLKRMPDIPHGMRQLFAAWRAARRAGHVTQT